MLVVKACASARSLPAQRSRCPSLPDSSCSGLPCSSVAPRRRAQAARSEAGSTGAAQGRVEKRGRLRPSRLGYYDHDDGCRRLLRGADPLGPLALRLAAVRQHNAVSMGAAARPPYLEGAYLVPEKVGSFEEHPFCLPWVRDFDLTLSAAVTFVIGENGSGKTTLVEALAVLAGLPASG